MATMEWRSGYFILRLASQHYRVYYDTAQTLFDDFRTLREARERVDLHVRLSVGAAGGDA